MPPPRQCWKQDPARRKFGGLQGGVGEGGRGAAEGGEAGWNAAFDAGGYGA